MGMYNNEQKPTNNFLLYLAEVAIEKKYLKSSDSSTSTEINDFVKFSPRQSKSTEYVTKTFKRQYVCREPGCSKTYTSNHGLQYHKKNGHTCKDRRTKPYKCEYKNCDRTYKNVNGLKYHNRVAHNEL